MRTSWDQARRAARTAVEPLEAVTVPLAEALGATLARPLRALVAVPSFDNSAMDGYAVAGQGPWAVTGRVRAGASAGALRPGQAVEIATGAPVPRGADAVLPVELAVRDRSSVTGDVRPGRHIRRAGESCAAGQLLLAAGTVVGPAVLGLAASVGHDALVVRRRPRVAAVLTGDEVVERGIPGPGRVRDAIGPMLPGVVRGVGGRCRGVTYLSDSPGALTEALWEVEADVVLVGGSTSAGASDHLHDALAALRADVLVDGVACRPGHPQVLAVLPDGRCVIGLPGNPFAALVAAVTLLVPVLESFGGREPRAVTAWLDAAAPHPRDTRLVPVLVTGARVHPVGHDRPGVLWGAALADALAAVPPLFDGGEVEILPLPR